MEGIKSFVDGIIQSNKVAVFAKSYCPFCKKAIESLNSFKPNGMHIEEIENNPKVDDIQDYLKEKTGARSVPRVFIGHTFFGGGDDTVDGGKNGKLEEALKKAGAV